MADETRTSASVHKPCGPLCGDTICVECRPVDSAATAHARALAKLQSAVSKALRTGRIDDTTWENLQSALVESNREVDPRG